jgi:hypothetical protein
MPVKERILNFFIVPSCSVILGRPEPTPGCSAEEEEEEEVA